MKKIYKYGKEKKCSICGGGFKARDADTDRYQSKYCSHSCRNKARAKHKEIKCMNCGKIFKPIRDKNTFCSRECYQMDRKKKPKNPEVVVNRKMAQFCCSVIHRCLRNKTDRTYTLLGYTAKELKSHLEKLFIDGMSWENYGKEEGQWSIDHIKPISKHSKDSTLSEINSLKNLQPLWHKENCSKRNTWEEQ